ncbi:MAG: CAP domain-containing protein [Armatimonadota bacterium]|nr:CAP domain-containing protein [Armatimonadota bacterium]
MVAKLVAYLASLLLSSGLTTSTTVAERTIPISRQAGVASSVGVYAPQGALGRLPTEAAPAVSCTDVEKKFVDLVNSERKRNGLPALSVNPLLVEVARDHSREMWEKNYFDHISPTPELRTPMHRYLKRLGHTPKWALLGENLFYCSVVDVDRGHRCLMQSPKHRENILNPEYHEIGIGCITTPDGRFYATQLFLSQVD